MMPRKKIGVVVQRYGTQINGGAEVHARMIAEKLNDSYDVTILTSRAVDYHTWQPELPAGETIENGIRVMRFDHPPKADPKKVHRLNRLQRGRIWYQKIFRSLGRPAWYLKLFPLADGSKVNGDQWLELQGPAMYELPEYLLEHKEEYAAYIFFTYLYYPTAVAMPPVGNKSLLIPTMHDEPAAYYSVFQRVMRSPAMILFNTESERRFSEKLFRIADVPSRVVAVGIDEVDAKADCTVPLRFGIKGKYILYVGRIDEAKGCRELLRYFCHYVANQKELTLVLAGKNMIKPVHDPQIIYAGFVSEEDKTQLMQQAEAVVIPSKYESLSLVLLESFACRVPVLANAQCEVLKDHVESSGGGWFYDGQQEFSDKLQAITRGNDRAEKAANGYRYVHENYTWEKVMSEFDEAIHFVEQKNSNGSADA